MAGFRPAYASAVLALIFSFSAVEAAEDSKTKLKEVQDRIKTHEKRLAELKGFESSVLDELESTAKELNSVEKDLRDKAEKLAALNKSIESVKSEIASTDGRIRTRSEWMKKKLRAVYRYGNLGDAVLTVVSSENLSQMLRRLGYLERLAVYEQKVIEDFRADLGELKRKRQSLEVLQRGQARQIEEVKQAELGLERKRQQKEILLTSVRKERDSYSKLIDELNAAQKRLEEAIRKAELEKYSGTGFRNLKGRLVWPADGRVALPYGPQRDPQFGTTIFRNGIYLRTLPGAVARPVYGGKVVFAEWFRGYGLVVIVNHGEGYHTLYGNFSEIFLKTGDIINKDTPLGRVGESMLVSAPALYFEVRYKGKPLDPMQWLAKK